ncbi:MAG: sensor histidine kinase [Verrucomicrobiota bacterium]
MSRAEQTVRSIGEIRALEVQQIDEGVAVELEARVTLVGYNRWSFFLHDGEEGIYVGTRRVGVPGALGLGSLVRVSGYVEAGGLVPHVIAEKVEVVGAPLTLRPTELDRDQLLDPRLDCQLVTFDGILLDVEDYPGRPYVYLKVSWESKTLVLRLIEEPDTRERLARRIHRRVRVTAIAASKANEARQMSDRYYQVNSLNEVELIESGPEEKREFGRLLRKDDSGRGVATVRGIVTHASSRNVYLRTEEASVFLRLSKDRGLVPGDRIIAEGHVLTRPFGPGLLAYSVSVEEKTEVPVPLPMPFSEEEYSSRLQNELVNLRCEVVGLVSAGGFTVVHCEVGEASFEARLPLTVALPEDVLPGSHLELTGICQLETVELIPHANLGLGDAFWILARSPGDFVVVEKAPWWSIGKLLVGISVLGGIALMSLLWSFALRRRVASQTQLIGEQIERESALNERQRLARELHDNLQQNLVGIAMHLDHASRYVSEGEEGKGAKTLDHVRGLVEDCREETRESISHLRSAESPRGSLAVYLEDAFREQAQGTGIQVVLETTGKVEAYDPYVVRQILGICREAFTNALRHSGASKVLIRFQYRDEALEVLVEDDGAGFTVDQVSPNGHYGIIGMRERADLIGADLDFEAVKGGGTQVCLRVSASHAERSFV